LTTAKTKRTEVRTEGVRYFFRVEEAEYVTEMARRIAALILMQPELDANYEAVKADTWPWPPKRRRLALSPCFMKSSALSQESLTLNAGPLRGQTMTQRAIPLWVPQKGPFIGLAAGWWRMAEDDAWGFDLHPHQAWFAANSDLQFS